MSKFTAKKRLNNTCNPSFIKPEGCEWVKSFNKETTLNEETEYLIVGTLTPPDGRGECVNGVFPGYFYCSVSNDMYSFLDASFPDREVKLVDLKEEFRNSGWDNSVKEEIKEELKARHIAFLDVVDKAYAKIGSSRYDDIDSYLLDKKSFKDLPSNLKVVANSNNAKIALEHILGIEDIEMIPQSLRGNWSYKNKEGLIKAWKEFFEKLDD